MSSRQTKKRILDLLQGDLPTALSALEAFAPRQVVSPLIGLLCHGEPRLRWHAVAALGQVVAALADEELEAARVVMRRLMWSLNDESGGIGWGAPEAMGEIMARHERLAREYAAILVSYLNPGGNFLEHEGLQPGLLWGVGRLARAHPLLAAPAAPFILPYMSSSDPLVRGMAVWAAAALEDPTLRTALTPLVDDPAVVPLFDQGRLAQVPIGRIAGDGLGMNPSARPNGLS